MATVQEILNRYRLKSGTGTAERAEQVPKQGTAQVGDQGEPIVAWDKAEYVGKTLPDEVIKQVETVRGLLPDVSTDPKWQIVKMQSDIRFMTGKDKKGKLPDTKGVDASKCVMFISPTDWKAANAIIEPDCKAAKAQWDQAEEKDKTKARIRYMKLMAFKHLMGGREGPSSAINTYDNAVFTWGMGFAATGALGDVLAQIHAMEKSRAPDDIEKHFAQKLFYLCGFKFDGRSYWVVDTTKKKLLVGATANPDEEDSAFRYIHDTFALHFMWVLAARDPLTQKTLIDAQREVFFRKNGDVARADKIQTAALYTFMAHLQHWTGDTAMGFVDWATGANARPPMTETPPSEKADAEMAIQTVHRFYRYRDPDKGNQFGHVRKYWQQMTTEDKADEGLTVFAPQYGIMTAGPVASVPDDHLAATIDGAKYDLGPLYDFGRSDTPPAQPAQDDTDDDDEEPQEEENPGAKWKMMPVTPPPKPPMPPLVLEPPSWYHCFPAGTLVACPGGERPIESLFPGDEVLAFDERKREVVPARVTRTAEHAPAPCLALELEDGIRVQVTENHPLATSTGWLRADEVREGTALFVLSGTRTVERRVRRVSPAPAGAGLHDLTVEPGSTYFAGGVLAHNKEL
jgi:hypothetical protein